MLSSIFDMLFTVKKISPAGEAELAEAILNKGPFELIECGFFHYLLLIEKSPEFQPNHWPEGKMLPW